MGRQTLIDSIDDRLTATPSGDYLNIFDTFDGAVSGNSVYNTNLWNGAAADLIPALTGVVWMAEGFFGGGLFPSVKAVAISRRHILVCGHVYIGLGTVRWILQNGTFVNGTTIDSIQDVGSEHVQSPRFFQVLYLSADLPSTVPLTPIFSPTFLDASTVHVPGTPSDTKPVDSLMLDALPVVPVIKFDQEHKMLVANSYNLTAGEYQANQMQFFTRNPGITFPTRDLYYEASIGGDSGSTILAVYEDQLIFLSMASDLVSSFLSGPHALWFVQSIITACATLDARNAQTGYTPEFFTFPEDMGYVTTRDYARTAITVSDEAG